MDTRISHSPSRWFAERKAEILADPDLSDAGRQRRLAEAADKMRAQARINAQEARDKRQAALDNPLRGLKKPRGGHNAETRRLLAEQEKTLKDPEKALNDFKGAIQAGDDQLAWAIGNVALQKVLSPIPGRGAAWVKVLEMWGESDSSVNLHLTELDRVLGEQPTLTEQMLEAATGVSPDDYQAPAGGSSGDPRDDLSEAGKRRQEKRDELDQVWAQQRSAQGPYIGPSPRPDPVDAGAPIRPDMWG